VVNRSCSGCLDPIITANASIFSRHVFSVAGPNAVIFPHSHWQIWIWAHRLNINDFERSRLLAAIRSGLIELTTTNHRGFRFTHDAQCVIKVPSWRHPGAVSNAWKFPAGNFSRGRMTTQSYRPSSVSGGRSGGVAGRCANYGTTLCSRAFETATVMPRP